jgi:hypothetical protein
MTALKDRFNHLCDTATRHLRALVAKNPPAPPPERPEPPARDILTHGAGKIVKLMKPLHWDGK